MSLSLMGMLFAIGCISGTADGGSAQVPTPETQGSNEALAPTGTRGAPEIQMPTATTIPAEAALVSRDQTTSILNVVHRNGTGPIENGGKVPLGDGEVMEVFIAPYPPEYDTDLHLFLMKEDTYEPVTDAVVYMLYEMVDMDHGDGGKQMGRQVGDGHYRFSMFFIMFGEYEISVTISWPDKPQLKQMVVKLMVLVYPEGFLG